MGSIYGKIFQISTFGESHGAAVGVVVQGCPSGIDFDLDFIQSELDRRKPGQSRITTQRKEADTIEVLSGVFEGGSLTPGEVVGLDGAGAFSDIFIVSFSCIIFTPDSLVLNFLEAVCASSLEL
jgi:hypothetical protein